MSINNKMNDAVTIIKMSAKSNKSNRYASIVILLNKSMCELLDLKIHVSNNNKFSDETIVTKNWNAIEKIIDSEKKIGTNEISLELENKVRTVLTTQNIELILLFATNNSIRSIVGLFDKIINELLDDTKTIYSVGFEFTSVEGVDTQRQNKNSGENYLPNIENVEVPNKNEKSDEKGDEASDLGDDCSIIKSSLLVSPVNGISIGQVKIGDKILVKIANESAIESRVIRELKPTELEDYQFIVPAEIININIIKTGGMSITIKFIDGVYSRIEETHPVKISIIQDKKFKGIGGFTGILAKIIMFGCFWVVLLIILAIYFYK